MLKTERLQPLSLAPTREESVPVAAPSYARQAPLHPACSSVPTVGAVIGSLAIGGAERIVLDWAQRNRARCHVVLCVLRDHENEWQVPAEIDVVRLRGRNIEQGLQDFARLLKQRKAVYGGCVSRPRVLCHMTRHAHRQALRAAGVSPVTVLHNARQGWLEPAEQLQDSDRVVAISQACVNDLAQAGRLHDVSLVRHLPDASFNGHVPSQVLRQRLCATLGIDERSTLKLIAMAGGVKPQKNYRLAIELMARLVQRHDAYLVIFGGPVGAKGPEQWQLLRNAVVEHGLQERVRLVGFVAEAARYFAAFDLFLNTSHYEGLSMATLEAQLSQVPVVASAVGGQGEIDGPGLILVNEGADAAQWVEAIEDAFACRPGVPTWASFPAHRLWNLESLVCDCPTSEHVVFVTANLNAGGAQRSLTNLLVELQRLLSVELVVTGTSSSVYFWSELTSCGVSVHLSAETKDCFDHAEALVRIVGRTAARAVCFWNVDPKVKLLLSKVLPSSVRLVDVSPGGYAFEEMSQTKQFQKLCGYSEQQYYRRLDQLVLKYHAQDAVEASTRVIPNGVVLPVVGSPADDAQGVRVIVNGRIAPSKFVVEIIEAMGLVWSQHPKAELHILGVAEQRHVEYARQVDEALGRVGNQAQVRLHGAMFELARVARPGDIAVVLGKHQGCPNAVLEAMACQMAVVANDSGGTAELLQSGQAGVLLCDTDHRTLGAALCELLASSQKRQFFGAAARARVATAFSMSAMVSQYHTLFQNLFRDEG